MKWLIKRSWTRTRRRSVRRDTVAGVTRTIAELGERRILLRALREGIDTATPTGRAVAAIMATLAELELEVAYRYLNQ